MTNITSILHNKKDKILIDNLINLAKDKFDRQLDQFS